MKVLILGSSGFVGSNMYDELSRKFDVIGTHRGKSQGAGRSIFFDVCQPESWGNVIEQAPDVIVNAAGYGVVRSQRDIGTMYDVNYLQISTFFSFLRSSSTAHFLQIGSAFEYDLSLQTLTEESACRPRSHYGISKFLMSHFLLTGGDSRYVIVRPFGMFGPYEHVSKFFPSLIAAQVHGRAIDLSSGEQVRDYVYVKDLSTFVADIILKNVESLPSVINFGTGNRTRLKDLAEYLPNCLPAYDETLWRWGRIEQRVDESPVIVNSSTLAVRLGANFTDYESAFKETVNYYLNGNSDR